MNLTENQITFISNSLELYGINNQDLKEDILDHICTYIETSNEVDFEKIYYEAIEKFGGEYNLKQLQRTTNNLVLAKILMKTNKTIYISSYVMLLCFIIGFVFKVFHWPYANATLLMGVCIFLCISLPLFLYNKYKLSNIEYQS